MFIGLRHPRESCNFSQSNHSKGVFQAGSTMYRFLMATVFVLLGAGFPVAEASEAVGDKSQLTVWLIPFDPPFETPFKEEEMPIRKQLEAFNQRWAASNITVLNTTVDWMVDQLVVWNPEYDLPNWLVVRGQMKTLGTLAEFAGRNNLHLCIRFLRWKAIIDALGKVIDARAEGTLESTDAVPDVVQIGSTWAAYFAEKEISVSPEAVDTELSWRKIENVPVSLPYTTDVRMLFYWKKLPGSEKPMGEWLKDVSDWQDIMEALSKVVLNHRNPAPPMVMPSGLTFDLFHDYIPLVWASGTPFFEKTPFGIRTNMGEREALKVPLLISKNATTFDESGRAYRIISIPEMSQESAAQHFMNRLEYVAIIQPAAFLSRWRRNFMKTVSAAPEAFWDCAGVALLPATFKGGSDLMVVNGSGKKEMAFQLIRYLASDSKHSGLASENGYLPAQNSDFGLSVLLNTLGGPSSSAAKNAVSLIHQALEKGREYPPIPLLPTRMESLAILESMQMLWRRIGEGDVQRVEKYAGKVALKINSSIYWPSSLWVLVKRFWPAITLILALAFFGLYLQSRKIAWRNRLLRIAVDSLRRRDYVLVSRAGAFVSDCRHASDRECDEFSGYLHDLRTRTLRLEENIRKDLEHSGRRSFPVSMLIHEAWENAVSQYRVAHPSAGREPLDPVLKDGLDHLRVRQMPYVFVAILQDWFYNSMKNDSYESSHMEVRLWRGKRKHRGLAVQSRYSGDGPILDQPFGPLPERVFALMSEQSKAAYGRIPVIKGIEMGEENSAQKCTVIHLPAPLAG